MAELKHVYGFVHDPRPPFPVRAGPIALTAQERVYALSDGQEAAVTVALVGAEAAWFEPGTPWGIASDRGEPYWFGTVGRPREQRGAAVQRLPLHGILDGLLEKDMEEGRTRNEPVGAAIRRALDFAQARYGTGVLAGNVDLGPTMEIAARGETVAAYIRSIASRTSLDLRERAVVLPDGTMQPYLDFGDFARATDIVLRAPQDIIDGVFERDVATAAVGVHGAGPTFETRRAAVVASGAAAGSAESVMLPAGVKVATALAGKVQGPGATKHERVFDERVATAGDVRRVAEARLVDRLRDVSSLALTLSYASEQVRRLGLGDICRIEDPGWNVLHGIEVDAMVLEIRPHEEDGTRDLVFAPVA